jgi:hypothetical protein
LLIIGKAANRPISDHKAQRESWKYCVDSFHPEALSAGPMLCIELISWTAHAEILILKFKATIEVSRTLMRPALVCPAAAFAPAQWSGRTRPNELIPTNFICSPTARRKWLPRIANSASGRNPTNRPSSSVARLSHTTAIPSAVAFRTKGLNRSPIYWTSWTSSEL